MTPRRSSAVSIGLAVVGVALVLGSLAVGWWSIYTEINPWTVAGHEYDFQATSTYLPGSDYRLWCTVNNTSMPGWGVLCPPTNPAGVLNPYSDPFAPAPSTVAVYADLEWAIFLTALLAGAGISMLAGYLVFPRGRRGNPLRFGWIVLLVAGALAIASPIGLTVAQPAAYLHDHPGSATAVTSFWGSCRSTSDFDYCGINTTQSWGAGAGWYLSLAAGTLLLGAGYVGRTAVRG